MEQKKEDFHTVISSNTKRDFIIFIQQKKGICKKGDISMYLEMAMRNLIKEDQQHQHSAYDRHAMTKEEEMITNLTELMKDISSYFWKLDNPFPFRCGIDVHKKTLKTAISAIRGNDYRTTKKWIERLLEFGFIRKGQSNQYKILNDGNESYDINKNTKPEPRTEISTEQKQQEFDSVMEGLK